MRFGPGQSIWISHHIYLSLKFSYFFHRPPLKLISLFILSIFLPHILRIRYRYKPAKQEKKHTNNKNFLFCFLKSFFCRFIFPLSYFGNNYWSMMLNSLMLIQFLVVVAPMSLSPSSAGPRFYTDCHMFMLFRNFIFLRICCGACFSAFSVAIIYFYE